MPYSVEIDIVLKDLIPTYLETRKKDLVQMKQWLEEKKYKEVLELLHRIKGSGGSYGFLRLTQLSGEMEDTLRKDPNAPVKHYLDQMEEYLSNLSISYVEDP